jgi:hypothetical protein
MDGGAEELDMVLNISQLRSGHGPGRGGYSGVVCEAAHPRGLR